MDEKYKIHCHSTNFIKDWQTVTQQAGRRLDSAPSANVVAIATKIGPLVVSPSRPKHIQSIWHTSRLIGDFVEK